MANHEHERLLRAGVGVWNNWRASNPDIQPDLSGINLWEHDLLGSIEESAEYLLSKELFVDGNPRMFCEITARSWFNLRGANLKDAALCFTNLAGADLSCADLSFANFYGASLHNASFYRSQLRGAIFSETAFGNTDLTGADNLHTCVHLSPSTIDVQTLINSGELPFQFLRGCGLPEEIIRALPSILSRRKNFFSCFISHSTKDHLFVKQLKDDLEAAGVRCYYFPENAKGGEKLWAEIGTAIKRYNKLLLVCSAQSLQSLAVLREIERALQREDHDKTNVLFPIRIDDYLFDDWQHDRKADILGKVVGDFRGWNNPDRYKIALGRLLQDLEPDAAHLA